MGVKKTWVQIFTLHCVGIEKFFFSSVVNPVSPPRKQRSTLFLGVNNTHPQKYLACYLSHSKMFKAWWLLALCFHYCKFIDLSSISQLTYDHHKSTVVTIWMLWGQDYLRQKLVYAISSVTGKYLCSSDSTSSRL